MRFQNRTTFLAAVTLGILPLLQWQLLPAAAQAPAGSDARDQQIWERFVKNEQKIGGTDRTSGMLPAQPQASVGPDGGMGAAPGQTFIIPSSMPPIYQRPVEFFRQNSPNCASGYCPGWSLGLGGGMPTGGLGSLGGLGNLGGFGGLGGLPSLAASSLLRGLAPGQAYAGYSMGAGGSALYPGLAPGAMYPGLAPTGMYPGSSFGNAWRSSGIGDMGRPAIYQTAPSKPSGNYYAPSNIDSTASGSYYAQTGPTPAQVIQSAPEPTNYWGPTGNPFGNQWNAQPPN